MGKRGNNVLLDLWDSAKRFNIQIFCRYSCSLNLLGVKGIDGDGDVYKPDNLQEFRKFVMDSTDGRGVHFVMADGVRVLRIFFSLFFFCYEVFFDFSDIVHLCSLFLFLGLFSRGTRKLARNFIEKIVPLSGAMCHFNSKNRFEFCISVT